MLSNLTRLTLLSLLNLKDQLVNVTINNNDAYEIEYLIPDSEQNLAEFTKVVKFADQVDVIIANLATKNPDISNISQTQLSNSVYIEIPKQRIANFIAELSEGYRSCITKLADEENLRESMSDSESDTLDDSASYESDEESESSSDENSNDFSANDSSSDDLDLLNSALDDLDNTSNLTTRGLDLNSLLEDTLNELSDTETNLDDLLESTLAELPNPGPSQDNNQPEDPDKLLNEVLDQFEENEKRSGMDKLNEGELEALLNGTLDEFDNNPTEQKSKKIDVEQLINQIKQLELVENPTTRRERKLQKNLQLLQQHKHTNGFQVGFLQSNAEKKQNVLVPAIENVLLADQMYLKDDACKEPAITALMQLSAVLLEQKHYKDAAQFSELSCIYANHFDHAAKTQSNELYSTCKRHLDLFLEEQAALEVQKNSKNVANISSQLPELPNSNPDSRHRMGTMINSMFNMFGVDPKKQSTLLETMGDMMATMKFKKQ